MSNVKSNKYSREKSQILKSKVQMTNQAQNPKSKKYNKKYNLEERTAKFWEGINKENAIIFGGKEAKIVSAFGF